MNSRKPASLLRQPLADADGDGDLDILDAAFDDSDISWWDNTAGDGSSWTEKAVDTVFGGADIDGDGDVDIVGAAFIDGDVMWWENTAGNGSSWTERAIDTDFDGARGLFVRPPPATGDVPVPAHHARRATLPHLAPDSLKHAFQAPNRSSQVAGPQAHLLQAQGNPTRRPSGPHARRVRLVVVRALRQHLRDDLSGVSVCAEPIGRALGEPHRITVTTPVSNPLEPSGLCTPSR